LRNAFEVEHEIQYGYRSPDEALQFTSLRIVARGLRPGESKWKAPRISTGAASAPRATNRAIYFGPTHGWAQTPVIGRGALDEEFRSGPLAIEEYDSTTIVPPGCRCRRDEWGNIVVELA
jgi:N-methylhydantoinase A